MFFRKFFILDTFFPFQILTLIYVLLKQTTVWLRYASVINLYLMNKNNLFLYMMQRTLKEYNHKLANLIALARECSAYLHIYCIF